MKKLSILMVVAIIATAFTPIVSNQEKERVYVANMSFNMQDYPADDLLIKIISLEGMSIKGVQSVEFDKNTEITKDMEAGLTRTITFENGERLVERFEKVKVGTEGSQKGDYFVTSEVMENPWNIKVDECLRMINKEEYGTSLVYIFSHEGKDAIDINKDASVFLSSLHTALK